MQRAAQDTACRIEGQIHAQIARRPHTWLIFFFRKKLTQAQHMSLRDPAAAPLTPPYTFYIPPIGSVAGSKIYLFQQTSSVSPLALRLIYFWNCSSSKHIFEAISTFREPQNSSEFFVNSSDLGRDHLLSLISSICDRILLWLACFLWAMTRGWNCDIDNGSRLIDSLARGSGVANDDRKCVDLWTCHLDTNLTQPICTWSELLCFLLKLFSIYFLSRNSYCQSIH